MGLFRRREQSTRDYPNATSVTGDAGRFRRHKTSGAREAGRAAEAWEQQDRRRFGGGRERRG